MELTVRPRNPAKTSEYDQIETLTLKQRLCEANLFIFLVVSKSSILNAHMAPYAPCTQFLFRAGSPLIFQEVP